MKKVLIIVAILVVVTVALTCYRVNKETKPVVSPIERCAFKSDMRVLWTDHAVYTREVIACLVDNAPGRAEAFTRLLNNQDDIGNAIKPYYGEKAGKALSILLREHIVIAANVVIAARNGDKPALDHANRVWYDNARRISEFLSTANPKLELSDVKHHMNYHLRLTTDEAVTRIQKKYQANIVAYDKVYVAILEMSDMISMGIVEQFPEKFTCDEEEGK